MHTLGWKQCSSQGPSSMATATHSHSFVAPGQFDDAPEEEEAFPSRDTLRANVAAPCLTNDMISSYLGEEEEEEEEIELPPEEEEEEEEEETDLRADQVSMSTLFSAATSSNKVLEESGTRSSDGDDRDNNIILMAWRFQREQEKQQKQQEKEKADLIAQALVSLDIKKLPAHIRPIPRVKRTVGSLFYKGTSFNKGQWMSQICFQRRNYLLGFFGSEWQAGAMYAWAVSIVNKKDPQGDSFPLNAPNPVLPAAQKPQDNCDDDNDDKSPDKPFDNSPPSKPLAPLLPRLPAISAMDPSWGYIHALQSQASTGNNVTPLCPRPPTTSHSQQPRPLVAPPVRNPQKETTSNSNKNNNNQEKRDLILLQEVAESIIQSGTNATKTAKLPASTKSRDLKATTTTMSMATKTTTTKSQSSRKQNAPLSRVRALPANRTVDTVASPPSASSNQGTRARFKRKLPLQTPIPVPKKRREAEPIPNLKEFLSTLEHPSMYLIPGPHVKLELPEHPRVTRDEARANPVTAEQLTDKCILIGRGGAVNKHAGNYWYRKLLSSYRDTYWTLPKFHKGKLAHTLVSLIRWQGGRFLEAGSFGVFFEVGDERAFAKTTQTLREGAGANLRSFVQQYVEKNQCSVPTIPRAPPPSSIATTRARPRHKLTVRQPAEKKPRQKQKSGGSSPMLF